MVLAAGLGTRLRPLTDRVPKPLVEIGGRPMIEYPLRLLAAAGVELVIVNLHHLGDQVRAVLGDGSRYGLRIEYSPEDPILDTGGGVARARPLLGDEPFVLANCDALLDVDLAAVWRLHDERGALATLVVRSDPDAERYGALDLDATGRVRRFLGRPPDVAAPLVRRMFCGVHVISPEIFEHLPSQPVFSITRDVYRPLVEAGAPVFGYDHPGYWRDLGTPESLTEARADLESGRFG
jgi:NDP-sugar pyrophosphorylase family protein